MIETREDRQKELQGIEAKDYIRLIRVYQDVIGTPHGQIPIPGIPPSRMIEVILKKEFPLTQYDLTKSGHDGANISA